MIGDPGYFGPQSMMWKINKEITVLFGGARALLMHAAHPLIAAGARQTSFYQRDPWKRLIRTLSLQNSVTFGTKQEADESAHRINKLHEVIKGKDSVSGGIYDALDHEQLLWVHACLQISSIYFYEKTVRKLTESEKNKYHEENSFAAEMVLVNKELMPKTHEDLKQWVITKSREKNYILKKFSEKKNPVKFYDTEYFENIIKDVKFKIVAKKFLIESYGIDQKKVRINKYLLCIK